MKTNIAIVEFEGQLWFELDGVKFDTLNADYEFDQKHQLEVIRNGVTIAKAVVTSARGDMIFTDYGAKNKIRIQGSALHAEDYLLGDHLVVEVLDGYALVDAVRKSCWFLEGLIETVPVGETLSLAKMKERITPQLQRTHSTAAACQVIRFRRDKKTK